MEVMSHSISILAFVSPIKTIKREKASFNMNELVTIKGNEIFTTSKIIAQGTNKQHRSVQKIISTYENDFKEFGQVRFEITPVKYARGTNEEKIYLLNEQQATLLMTYLRNNEVVRQFKKRLVDQFFKMRDFIKERNTEDWQQARLEGKKVRLQETDTIKRLVAYAEAQGSRNADKLYLVYTKLVKKVVAACRNDLTIMELIHITQLENMVLDTINYGMAQQMDYKLIYRVCKSRLAEYERINSRKYFLQAKAI